MSYNMSSLHMDSSLQTLKDSEGGNKKLEKVIEKIKENNKQKNNKNQNISSKPKVTFAAQVTVTFTRARIFIAKHPLGES